jgi:peptidoglycan/xylan/chitin deacetylase (PgdA/CDA1 family)
MNPYTQIRHSLVRLARPFGHTAALGTVHRVETSRSVAALTFDDGPDPTTTPDLLDLLDAHEARATFFVVGRAASEHGALIREIHRRGHVLGNHTWSHSPFRSLSSRQRRDELRRCDESTAPFGTRLFRAPWGDLSLSGRLDLLLKGYQVIGWDVQVQDWLDVSAADIACRLKQQVRPGSIILLHDALYQTQGETGIASNRRAMLDGLEMYLTDAQNLQFTTIPALLRAGNPVYEPSTG